MSGLTVVYTSVFGAFETVWPALRQPATIQRFLISDSVSSPPGWNLIVQPLEEFGSARLANRHQKMLFQASLSPEGFSVYIDANVRPVESLLPLFKAFEASGADLGMYRHYARSSVHDEAQACIAREKVDDPGAVAEELGFYQSKGFPDSGGMWEGSVIFKKHASKALGPAMQEWWELYSRFTTRDQFSLPFVIWKHNLTVFDLDSHRPGREHYFVRLQHSQDGIKNRLARYLQARAPENSFWKTLHTLAKVLDKD